MQTSCFIVRAPMPVAQRTRRVHRRIRCHALLPSPPPIPCPPPHSCSSDRSPPTKAACERALLLLASAAACSDERWVVAEDAGGRANKAKGRGMWLPLMSLPVRRDGTRASRRETHTRRKLLTTCARRSNLGDRWLGRCNRCTRWQRFSAVPGMLDSSGATPSAYRPMNSTSPRRHASVNCSSNHAQNDNLAVMALESFQVPVILFPVSFIPNFSLHQCFRF